MKPAIKLSAAFIRAVDSHHKGGMPYFASTLISFPQREAPKCPTMAMSERGVLYYNRAFIEECTVPELATVLLHETLHFVRDHAQRGRTIGAHDNSKLAEIWNIACDMEINDDLKEAECPFPQKAPGVFPSSYGFDPNLLAEAYYRLLLDEAEKSGEGEGDEEDGEGEGGKPGSGNGKIMAGGCGSVAGNKGEWEEDDVEEEMGRTESSADAIRQSAAIAIAEAASDPTKGQGNVPAGLARWAEDRLGPSRIPWQTLLAMAIRAAATWARGKTNYTFKRRSRRQAALGMGRGAPIIPGMRKPVPEVWGVIDTSGSMGTDELGDAMRETKAVMDAIGTGLSFVTCDATIQEMQKVTDFEQAKKLLKGGGGTSFVPVFEAYEKTPKNSKPNVIIMFTDGGGDAPKLEPQGVKVIWCLVGAHRQKPVEQDNWSTHISWGDFIEVEPEEKK